ncbi:MAG: FAD-dependent oxidoreductase [Candidatus Sumerlaeia bacterium]
MLISAVRSFAVFRSDGSLRIFLAACPVRALTVLMGGLLVSGFLSSCVSVKSPQLSGTGVSAAVESFDIVVAGGSLGAVSAAFMAARANPDATVLLTEPTDWLGGQATSQGVAAPDNAWHDPGATLMREQPESHYARDYLEFLERIQTAPADAPGLGWAGEMSSWVSRHAFDPRTAAWVLDQMAAAFPNLTVRKMTVVKKVETVPVHDHHGDGFRITAITFIERTPRPGTAPFTRRLSEEIHDWYTAEDSPQFTKKLIRVVPRDPAKGFVVVDGSELADVVVLSGAVYVVGREKTTEKVGEDGRLPEFDERASMACVFPFCMRLDDTPDPERDVRTEFPDFEAYYKEQSASFYSLKNYSWQRVWTYRRIHNAGAPWQHDSVFAGDVSMQNWNPGNDYLYEMFYKTRVECAAEAADWKGGVLPDVLARMEKHALGWYVWMKEHKPAEIPGDTRLCRGTDPSNMMGTRLGLAKFPYIRDTRHIIGLDNFRIEGRYFVPVTGDPKTFPRSSFRFFDTVGIACYAADIRPVRGREGIAPPFEKPAPFYIPYRALGSVNVRNLLAAGKLYALTYVSNSAYRVHPAEWNAGVAAGAAAALLARDGGSNYDLLQIARLRGLQRTVLTNAPLGWLPFDEAERIPARDGDLVVNDLKPIEPGRPFLVEIYHPTAVKATVLLDGETLGETTRRSNGRLIFEAPGAPAGAVNFGAVLFDADGREIARL